MIGAYLHFNREVIRIEHADSKEWVAFITKFVQLDEADKNDRWTLVDRCELLRFLYSEATAEDILPDLLLPLIKPTPAEIAD